MNVLEVDRLSVAYGRQPVLRELSLSVAPGEAYGLIGESGCGKTTAALAAMRYLPRGGRVTGGTVRLGGIDLLRASARRLRQVRGSKIAMVYQHPGAALNPALPVGRQIAEVYQFHDGRSRAAAAAGAVDALERVGLPAGTARRYPHQLSGGQQQRVVIAMALAGRPELLVLDEPTTGLDASVAAGMLDLVAGLRADLGMAVLFISHDLDVVARICQRVGVLYAGRLVEEGPTGDVLPRPRHRYTAGLVSCLPGPSSHRDSAPLRPIPGSLPAPGQVGPGCVFADRCGHADQTCRDTEPPLSEVATGPGVPGRPGPAGRRVRCWHPAPPDPELSTLAAPALLPPVLAPSGPAQSGEVVLRLVGVGKAFGDTVAVDDVSLDLRAGEVLGIVGESGSGKTTLGQLVVGLVAPDAGEIRYRSRPLAGLVERRTRAERRALQLVFQRPDVTVNPRRRVRSVLARAVRRLGGTRSVDELAGKVALGPAQLDGYARQLSGGMKQRVAIARAFAGNPAVVVCDEPTSSLDVSVQATVLNLLADLARDGTGYLFISHDLAAVRYLADRIGVMYRGRIVEIGPTAAVLRAPRHPYTELLVSTVPGLNGWGTRDAALATTLVPGLATALSPAAGRQPAPGGCVFALRCPRSLGARCETVPPPAHDLGDGHLVHCHLASAELAAVGGEADGRR